jgi:TatD DNase family protein
VRLVDSHCHLQADRFAGDVVDVLDAARSAGVERILVPGWDRDSSEAALELAEQFRWLDVAVGVHPHAAATADAATLAWVEAAALDEHVVAIGETGLDFDRMFAPQEAQLANVRAHIAIAVRTGKPVILHCRSAPGRRDAQDAIVRALREAGAGSGVADGASPRPTTIIHSFSGPPDYAGILVDMGCVISFSGLVFRSGEEASAEAARLAHPARLLVETDAPYLSPPGAPRRRNAPEHVAITAAWLATQRGVPLEALGDDLVAAYDFAFPRDRAR